VTPRRPSLSGLLGVSRWRGCCGQHDQGDAARGAVPRDRALPHRLLVEGRAGEPHAPAQPAPLVWLQGDTRRGDGVLRACCALLLQVESDSSTERDASSGAEVRPHPLSIQRSACALLRVCSRVTEPVRAERREQVLEAARTARLRVGARCRLRRGGGERRRSRQTRPCCCVWTLAKAQSEALALEGRRGADCVAACAGAADDGAAPRRRAEEAAARAAACKAHRCGGEISPQPCMWARSLALPACAAPSGLHCRANAARALRLSAPLPHAGV